MVRKMWRMWGLLVVMVMMVWLVRKTDAAAAECDALEKAGVQDAGGLDGDVSDCEDDEVPLKLEMTLASCFAVIALVLRGLTMLLHVPSCDGCDDAHDADDGAGDSDGF